MRSIEPGISRFRIDPLRGSSGMTDERIENMNFDDTPQEAAFRAEAKAWISANAPKQYEEELRKASLGRTGLKNANMLEVAKAWQKKKADAGWACLHWPKEYAAGARRRSNA